VVTQHQPGVPVIVVRRVGKGLVAVIGDTCFAMNKNLEREDGSPFEGLRENAVFWRWFLALLSVSWIVGLEYYHGAQWWAWGVTVAAGVALLVGRPVHGPSTIESAAALAMCLPAALFMPWPYRAAPLLICVGAALGLFASREDRRLSNEGPLPLARSWLGSASGACLLAGCTLLAQAMAMLLYAIKTSRSRRYPQGRPNRYRGVPPGGRQGLGADRQALRYQCLLEERGLHFLLHLRLCRPLLRRCADLQAGQ